MIALQTNRVGWLVLATWLGLALGLGLPQAKQPRRPNIVGILTDDLGYGEVSVCGRRDVLTPHVDSLASAETLCKDMRANRTVCAPTRAALLAGRYPDRVGVPGVIRTHAENSWGYFFFKVTSSRPDES